MFPCFEYLHRHKSSWVGTGFGEFSYDNRRRKKDHNVPKESPAATYPVSPEFCAFSRTFIQRRGTEQTDGYVKPNNHPNAWVGKGALK